MARADSGVKAFLEGHGDARLVDVRHGVFSQTEGNSTAYVWNLTWLDLGSHDWYSYVRVRYVGGPLLPPLLLQLNPPSNTSFASWKSGPFSLEIPRAIEYGAMPDLDPEAALRAYFGVHASMPSPLYFRWTLLTSGGPLTADEIFYVSSFPAWGIAWGELTYRLDSSSGSTSFASSFLADTWMISASGELQLATVPE